MIEEKIHGHHLSIYSQLAIVSLHINWHIYLEELASSGLQEHRLTQVPSPPHAPPLR